jgi:hypothetical protein
MIKLRGLESAAMCVTFFAMTLICGGCNDNKPLVAGGGGGKHPLTSAHGRKCPSGTPQDYPIAVAVNKDIFTDPSDQALVVCENDTVSWAIQSGNGVITVTFTDSYGSDLFGKSNIPHPSGSKSETEKQTVQSQKGHEGRVYKYTIVVQDSGLPFSKDPHVIPMGNGGP